MRNAAIVVIGNEIITGRTQDLNVQYIAKKLDQYGIELKEIRIIPDIEKIIITNVNELRSRHDYIFTTGGIGPTHDDITAASIAKALHLPITRHPEIVDIIYKRNPKEHEASYRMADIPEGATLIGNPVTQVPGFKIENIFVMAGVPAIMQGLFDSIVPMLEKGSPTLSQTINCHLSEGSLALGLSKIQDQFQNVEIGSYPYTKEPTEKYNNRPNHHPNWAVNVVLRSKEEATLKEAARLVENLIKDLGGDALSL